MSSDIPLSYISYNHELIDVSGASTSANLYVSFVNLDENSLYEVTVNFPNLNSALSYGSCLVYLDADPLSNGVTSVTTVSNNSNIAFSRALLVTTIYGLLINVAHTGSRFHLSVVKKC